MSFFRRIGQIARNVMHGPERYRELKEALSQSQEQLAADEKALAESREEAGKLREELAQLREELAQVREELTQVREGLAQAREALAASEQRMNADEQYLREARNAEPEYMDLLVSRLCEDDRHMEKLNLHLSFHPTLWGNPERLKIDPTATVGSCMFNTNSGNITIGAHSFAGSRVSVLAGSHDMLLTGERRQKEEMTEGCDIVIGAGVWLASGCTVLGPCTIGDNAVIAAGAVVTPGTKVPAGTVWGGVPARQIRTIQVS